MGSEAFARWAARTGGSVVELHAYSVSEPTDTESMNTVRDALIARMHELYPETVTASIVDERVLLRGDCPRFAPGDFAERPTVRTPDPRIMLAGDGIRIDLPVDAHIPAEYIASERLRLEAYTKFAAARSDADVDDVLDELADRYGAVPEPVRRLERVQLRIRATHR